MNKKFINLSDAQRLKKLAAMPDEEIDYSDIPPLDEDFFASAKLVTKEKSSKAISIRLDIGMLDELQSIADEEHVKYQTLIKDVLRTFVVAWRKKQDKDSEALRDKKL